MEELDKRAFLCRLEALADDDLFLGVPRGEVDAHRVLGRLGHRGRAWFASQALEEGVIERVNVESYLVQFLLGDDAFGLIGGAVLALDGLLEVADDIDDAVGTRYLHPVIGVIGTSHELGEGGSPEDAVVRTFEVNQLEADLLSWEVLLRAERHV
jgi:hypothetical protein